MPLSPALVLILAGQCAPTVAQETMVSLAQVESGFDPLAIGVNGPRPQRIDPTSLADAITIATRLIAGGANIDLGLGQINSANLGRLGISLSDAFEPCYNLHAAGQVLQQAYQEQSPSPGHEQAALRRAISIYNTGRPDRGFANGYVAKVVNASSRIVPALAAAPVGKLADTGPSVPASPSWDVFGQAGRTSLGFVISASPTSGDQP